MSRLYIDFYQEVSFEENESGFYKPQFANAKSFRSFQFRNFHPSFGWSSKIQTSLSFSEQEIRDFFLDFKKIGCSFDLQKIDDNQNLIKCHSSEINLFSPFCELITLCLEMFACHKCNLFDYTGACNVYRCDLDSDYSAKIYQDLLAFYPLISDLNEVNRKFYLDFLNCFAVSAQNGMTIFTFYKSIR